MVPVTVTPVPCQNSTSAFPTPGSRPQCFLVISVTYLRADEAVTQQTEVEAEAVIIEGVVRATTVESSV